METTEIALNNTSTLSGGSHTLTASKPKKERSEAQINATKRALEALQAKRKENWEKKKENLANNIPKEEIKQPTPLKETMEKIVNKQITSTIARDDSESRIRPETAITAGGGSEVPEWAKVIYEKIEKLSKKRDKESIKKKQKKRVIIEESESESESSDEEVIIKKKKKHIPPTSEPTPAPAPVIKPINENPLRKLLNRR